MSNTVDFHQIQQSQTILPADSPMVLINSQVSGLLTVNKIVRAAYPEFSWAELQYNPAALKLPKPIVPEDIENSIPIGSSISICHIFNGSIGSPAQMKYVLFHGYIEKINTVINEKTVCVTFIARDISAALERIIVMGQRIYDDGRTVFLKDKPLAFNADGQNNRSPNTVANNGRSYHIFGHFDNESFAFDYSQAINYLLCEYVPHGIVDLPNNAQYTNLFDHIPAYDIDVDGLSLIKALYKICRLCGVEFYFLPCQSEQTLDTNIVFYRPGHRRLVELNMQYPGQSFNITHTNIHTVDSERSYWPITHRYIGLGEFKEYEATFDLIKAWSPSKEGGDIEAYSTAAEDFESVENVYRRWCLNEAGDYTGSPYNQGSSYDFDEVFQTENYIHRKRKFLDCITVDADGNSLGQYLEISYNSGKKWQRYEGKFNVLADECGIWISEKLFDDDFWTAAEANKLRFRITASVQSDQRLTYRVADGPVNSSVTVIDKILNLPANYYFRQISKQSIFYSIISDDFDASKLIDDTPVLFSHIRQQANADIDLIEEIVVTTPIISPNFEPGDQVTTSPDSRDILGIRKDPRSLFWVDRVEIDFEKQSTKLKIFRQRKYPL